MVKDYFSFKLIISTGQAELSSTSTWSPNIIPLNFYCTLKETVYTSRINAKNLQVFAEIRGVPNLNKILRNR